jgi:prophage antirepressor-like protein
MNAKEKLQVTNLPEVFTFNPSNAPIRVQVINSEPYFVAKDVCVALGIEKYRDAVSRLDDDERGRPLLMDTLSGKQEMSSVSESGLYNLIFQSRKPEAKTFRKWVTSEVLPSIRKTGQYKIERTRLRPELAVADNIPNVSRNHIFPVDYIEICDHPIRRVTIDGQFYYCLVDIQVAAGMDSRHRSQLERGIRKAYSFKIHTKNNGKLADYLNAEGVRILCSRSSIPFARQQFLVEFNRFVSPFDLIIDDYKKFDYVRFLDIIIRTKDESDRDFLYELYKQLGGH